MRRVRRSAIVLALVALLTFVGTSQAIAQQPKNAGLYITPVRQYLTVAPGHVQTGSLTVANITNKPITVTMSVEQFSVADYTYDYQFQTATEKWVSLNITQFQLQPDKSQVVIYSVAPPTSTSPGGHYFTIFATTTLERASSQNQVRDATILYVTAGGALTKTSQILSSSIPWIFFGTKTNFTMTVKDTGNTHFFTYASGRLQGLSAKDQESEVTNLLMPGASRSITASIPAPLLPGIYKATYGFRTDDGQSVQRSAYVVYIPPWSAVIPLGIIWLFVTFLRYRRARR